MPSPTIDATKDMVSSVQRGERIAREKGLKLLEE
jgi:hypothetical protein